MALIQSTAYPEKQLSKNEVFENAYIESCKTMGIDPSTHYLMTVDGREVARGTHSQMEMLKVEKHRQTGFFYLVKNLKSL